MIVKDNLQAVLNAEQNLELAVLVGSRATGRSSHGSDWDIAIRWRRGLPFMTTLAAAEKLRNNLAAVLEVTDDRVDLIDISSAQLAMRAAIVEEGLPLKGGESIAWNRLLTRTWRELEEYYWESVYAA